MGRTTRAPSWIERIDLDRYWRFALPLAAAGLVTCSLIVATTFLPGDPLVPDGIVFLLFVVTLPIHFGTVASGVQLRRSDPWEDGWPRLLSGALSKVQRIGLVAVVGTCLLIAGLSIAQFRGQPERHGDRYYLSYQANLTEVSRSEYIEHRKLGLRVFGSAPALFCAIAVGAGLGHRRRHLLDPPPDPWPGPDFHPGPGAYPPPRPPPA